MALPTKRSVVTHTEPSLFIIYGPPKVGKTSSVAQLDSNLIIDAEQPSGTKFISCLAQHVMSYSAFQATCNEIIGMNRPYKYVTLDTIDAFERMCALEANTRYMTALVGKEFKGTNILTQLPKGAGYPWLWDAIRDGLDLLAKCAPRVILVGHLKEKLLTENMVGEDSEGADLDLTGKVRNIVCARADAIGLMTRRVRLDTKPGQPKLADLWINFKTTDATNCGCRIPRLAGREFIFATHEERRAKWEEIYPSLLPPSNEPVQNNPAATPRQPVTPAAATVAAVQTLSPNGAKAAVQTTTVKT